MLWHMPLSGSKPARQVRLFRNGRNQAVRIPRELELPGTEALLYPDEGRLILEPIGSASLLKLLESWQPIDTDWPEVGDPAPAPVEIPD